MNPTKNSQLLQIESPRKSTSRFLPMTRDEMTWRGWSELDVLLISGDAYVDHPSFGISALGRLLESLGLKVGIIAQPRFASLQEAQEDFTRMGRPRLFLGVSAGTVDSMINNYTANKKPRSDDMYSPGGLGGRRPDYATCVYAKLAREFFPEVPLVVGGVEASLRRLAHYDYWTQKVRPSILTELTSDLFVFGMGERQVRLIVEEFLSLRSTFQGPLSRHDEEVKMAIGRLNSQRGFAFVTTKEEARQLSHRLTLPSYEEVRSDKKKFAKAAYFIEYEASPFNGKKLVQYHGTKAVVINSPALPLTTQELDALYEFPYVKDQHPSYTQRIPAADMIRMSVATTRGCFGGCSFCAITLHQGRVVQSRSQESVLKEVEGLKDTDGFKGQISDLGGPTANIYQLRCKGPEIQSKCRKLSCVHPKICPHLHTDHTPQVELLKKARKMPHVKKIHIASGLRYDLALHDKKAGHEYLKDLITHHVGGHLKVAPEHLDHDVLHLMKKPSLACFDEFRDVFEKVSKDAGKEQYLIPYFISGFPGTTAESMERITDYMAAEGWKLRQVQAFIPTPMTLATAMYYTGFDPMTMKPLFVAKTKEDRQLQQALLQPHKPEHQEILRKYKNGDVLRRVKKAWAKKRVSSESSEVARERGQSMKIPKKKLGRQLFLDSR